MLFGEVMPLYAAVWAYSKFLEFGLAVHAILRGTLCKSHSCECYIVIRQLTFPAAVFMTIRVQLVLELRLCKFLLPTLSVTILWCHV